MKVLLVHNFYGSESPSGENVSFLNEYNLLRNFKDKYEINVKIYKTSNDVLNRLNFYEKISKIFDPKDELRNFQKFLIDFQPDIIHFHNVFYVLSPIAFKIAKQSGAVVIKTLHNYRYSCLNGLFFKNGKICMECMNGPRFKSVLLRCYDNSMPKSFILYLYINRFRKYFFENVDAYIALTKSNRDLFVKMGVPTKKIFIKPHFFENRGMSHEDQNFALFIGRFSPQKGIEQLIKIWEEIDFPLKIMGAGPLETELKNLCRKLDLCNKIEFIGYYSGIEKFNILKRSSFVVFPSIFIESFGMVLGEAYSVGKPVVATNVGPIKDIVEHGLTGYLFNLGDLIGFKNFVKILVEDKKLRQRMGQRAYEEYLKKYTPEKNVKILVSIYKRLLNSKNASF